MTRRGVLIGAILAGMAALPAPAAAGGAATALTAYVHGFTAIDGAPMPLSAHAGKVMLIVNTASRCGFTNQYAGLQELHERYAGIGLVVIGVPSNDFGGQEPGSNEEIRGFCSGTFGVNFALAQKSTVTGPEAHPFYRWAYRELGAENAPRWNFHKYLVGRDGRLIAAFGSSVRPTSEPIVSAIERALATPAS